jgi:hypothetical protein
VTQIEIHTKKINILHKRAEACQPFTNELAILQSECKHPNLEPVGDFSSECPDCGYFSIE